MNPHDLEVLLQIELSANHSLEWLLERIFKEEADEGAAESLRTVARQLAPEENHALLALNHYRQMRRVLSGDFTWLQFEDAPHLSPRVLRRERTQFYRRYRELFELEIAIIRRQKRAAMAASGDWSGMSTYVRDGATLGRCFLMLYSAQIMFSTGLPGALDLCDQAVTSMFRVLYLHPAA